MLDAIGSLNYSNVGSGNSTSSDGRAMARPHQRAQRLRPRRDLPDRPRSAARLGPDLSAALRLRQSAAERDDQPRLSRRLRAARVDRRQRLPLPAAAARASAIRPSRSCCRSPTATGRARPTRSAAGGTSTPIFSTSSARSARRPAALSLGSEWDRSFRDPLGGQYKFSASVRGDGYSVNNLSPISNPDLPSAFFPVNGQPALAPIGDQFRDRPGLPASRAWPGATR